VNGKTLSPGIHRAIQRCLWLSVVALGAILMEHRVTAKAGDDPSGDPLKNYHKVWEAKLPISGDEVASPPMARGGSSTYRVLVSGAVDTGGLGVVLDGQHNTDQSRQFRLKHDHLKLDPPALSPVYRNRVTHRYVYEFAEEFSPSGKRVTARFEGLAYRFRVSQARLARESKSTLKVSLWKRGPAPGRRGAWVLYGLGLALILVVAILIFRVIRSRRKA
jgi:hypothetical protein